MTAEAYPGSMFDWQRNAVIWVLYTCSGFPCEDTSSPAMWTTEASVASNSKPCSCETGFQQCSPGMYSVIHV